MEEYKKDAALLYFGILFLMLALAMVGIALYVRSGHEALGMSALSAANRAYNEGRKEEAYELYRSSLTLDPENLGALEGLMQLAAKEHEEEELLRLCYIWLNLAEQSPHSTEDKRLAILDVLAKMDDEELIRESVYAYEHADMQNAYAALDELSEDGLSENAARYKAQLLAALSKEAWDTGDLSVSYARIEHAHALAPEDETIAAAYERILREDVLDLASRQDTARALDLAQSLDRAQKQEAEEAVQEQDAAALRLTEDFEKLTSALVKKDNEKLSRLLTDEDFEAAARSIDKVFYDAQLLENGGSGKGMALYRDGNQSYIYYGDFADGERNGSGQWFFSEDEGKLTIFELNWEDDMPVGEGERLHYSALVSRSEGGGERSRSSTEETDHFTLSLGVMDGSYEMKSKVIAEEPYDYAISYELKNGYCSQILPGEYPELIDYYLAYPQPLAGYTEAEAYDPFYEEEYTTTIWYLWTPSRWTVDGVAVTPAAAVSQLRTLSLAE